jgi:hypothetical protein
VLLEPGDGPLDHVALAIAHWINPRRPATSWSAAGPGGLLVGALRDGVGDPAAPQRPAAGRVAVAPVGNQVGGALAGPAPSTRARDSNGVQQRAQLGALMALTGGDQHPQRPATAIAGQVDLGREPAAATSQRLVILGNRP